MTSHNNFARYMRCKYECDDGSEYHLYCGRGIEIGRSVSLHAGRTPAEGTSVSSSGMYKYSNSPTRRLWEGKV